MTGIIQLIGSLFNQVFQWIDNFILFGSFSLLDFLIACIVVDIVITALFVTFNIHVGSSQYVDKQGKTRVRRDTSVSSGRGK